MTPEELKKIMKDNRLDPAQMAKKLGKSERTIYRWMGHPIPASMVKLIRLTFKIGD